MFHAFFICCLWPLCAELLVQPAQAEPVEFVGRLKSKTSAF